MSTTIKIQVSRPEEMSEEKWNEFKDDFQEKYEDIDAECEDFISTTHSTSYRLANLVDQTESFKDKWGKHELEFSMWFLETSPDEELTLTND